MKKLVIILMTAVLALSLAACGEKEPAGQTQVPNPMVGVDGPAAFETELGIKLLPPEGATDVKCFIISDYLAHMSFTLDGVEYVARAAKDAEGDISGLYVEFEDLSGKLNADYADHEFEVISRAAADGSATAAAWSYDGADFSLVVMSRVEFDAINAVALAMHELAIAE